MLVIGGWKLAIIWNLEAAIWDFFLIKPPGPSGLDDTLISAGMNRDTTVDPTLTLIYTSWHVANHFNYTGYIIYPESL